MKRFKYYLGKCNRNGTALKDDYCKDPQRFFMTKKEAQGIAEACELVLWDKPKTWPVIDKELYRIFDLNVVQEVV